jgi:hypothetical protein
LNIKSPEHCFGLFLSAFDQFGLAKPVRLATLGPDGPTAGYFFDDQTLPW